MAKRQLDIVARVIDAASDKLKKINESLGNTGKSAKGAGTDITKLNRTLFATTAYIALFQRAFSGFAASIDEAAGTERLSGQFERMFGDRNKFFSQLDEFTTTNIDKFEAMRSAVSLKSLGIVKSTKQMAMTFAKAGTAAKLAGKSSAEGIKAYTDFLKDGSVSHLEFLNLIARTNPALQAQLSILKATGGIMGQVISTQQKLSLGSAILNAATRGQMHGQRDLLDVTEKLRNEFDLLKFSTFGLIGNALAPFSDKLIKVIGDLRGFIDLVKNDGPTLKFVRAISLSIGAVGGLAAVLGTLRLVLFAIGTSSLGIPGMIVGLGALTASFLVLEKPANNLLQTFGKYATILGVIGAAISVITGNIPLFLGSIAVAAGGYAALNSDQFQMPEFAKKFQGFGSMFPTDMQDTLSGMYIDRSKTTGIPNKSNVVIPPPLQDNEESRINKLNEVMSGLDAFKAARMTESMKAAKTQDSEGGVAITRSEYFTIMKEALDSSDNLSIIARTVSDKMISAETRRGF